MVFSLIVESWYNPKINSLREKSQKFLFLGYFSIGGPDFYTSIKKFHLINFVPHIHFAE